MGQLVKCSKWKSFSAESGPRLRELSPVDLQLFQGIAKGLASLAKGCFHDLFQSREMGFSGIIASVHSENRAHDLRWRTEDGWLDLEGHLGLVIAVDQNRKDPLLPGRSTFLGTNPMTMMQNIAEQNLSMWKSMQENFYTPPGEQPAPDDKAPTQESTTTSEDQKEKQ